MNSVKNGVSNVLSYAIAAPFLALTVAGAPIVGLLALPVLGAQAIFHAIAQNFHLRHAKNAEGTLLSQDIDPETQAPKYIDQHYSFSAEDLTGLKHERDRIKAKNDLHQTIDHVKQYAKLLIPVIGLYWFFVSEDLNPKRVPTFHKDLSAVENHIRNFSSPDTNPHNKFWENIDKAKYRSNKHN